MATRGTRQAQWTLTSGPDFQTWRGGVVVAGETYTVEVSTVTQFTRAYDGVAIYQNDEQRLFVWSAEGQFIGEGYHYGLENAIEKATTIVEDWKERRRKTAELRSELLLRRQEEANVA